MEAAAQTEAVEAPEAVAALEQMVRAQVSLSLPFLQSTELTTISPEVELAGRVELADKVEPEAMGLPEDEVVTALIAPVPKVVPAPAAMAEVAETAVKVVTAASAEQVDKEEVARTLP
jgi:hypothetical protein